MPTDPIDRAAAVSLPYSLEPGSAAGRVARGGFRAALEASAAGAAEPADASPARAALREAALSIARGEQRLGQVIQRSLRGGTLSNEQLIALQATVYRYTQEIELAAKLVDKATSAVRQTLTSQQ